jgi:CRISPR-associated protein Csb2
VPNNVADLVAGAWARGTLDASIADHRVEKDIRPTHLSGKAVHYLFALSDDGSPHMSVLTAAARSVTHLGWGVDMVAANATVLSDDEAARLSGERWQPVEGASGNGLRVPIEGTLNDLVHKHEAFLKRLSDDGFKPVPSLSAFRVVSYRRASEPPRRPFAAFSILTPDASGNRAFDTVRRARDVAAWVRYATGTCQH